MKEASSVRWHGRTSNDVDSARAGKFHPRVRHTGHVQRTLLARRAHTTCWTRSRPVDAARHAPDMVRDHYDCARCRRKCDLARAPQPHFRPTPPVRSSRSFTRTCCSPSRHGPEERDAALCPQMMPQTAEPDPYLSQPNGATMGGCARRRF